MNFLTAIPIYNEARHVHTVLDEVRRYSPNILVVDDGSTDGTAELLQAEPNLAVVTHAKNKGYGAALVSAFDYSLRHGYDTLVTMDCDGQHEPARIAVLLEAIHDADIVSASRYLRDFRQTALPTPADRRFINRTITAELNDALGLNLTDAFCGFKAYRASALARLHITETGWGMPLQLWVQAAQASLRIKEIGVPRLYLDPNRAFGGGLDDTDQRLAYYRKVIADALAATATPTDFDFECFAACNPPKELPVTETSAAAAMADVHDLEAPQDDGAILAHPPLDEAGQLADDNRRLDVQDFPVLGKSFHAVRELARGDVLAAARSYMTAAGEPLPASHGDRLFLAGHQPELFHPGVWTKNFALTGLARRLGGTAVNLVVDNDTAKKARLAFPKDGDIVQVPYDLWQSEVPYEERHVLDEEMFRRFPEAAAEITKTWNFTPILPDFWAEVVRQGQRTPLLGERFAAARRTFERRWGCHNLEVPLSRVCETEGFAWFAAHLLDELPRFHAIYNDVVHAYRRRYHMRSRNHPVPDLARDGEWLEAPLWAWRHGQKRRGRLFARRTAAGLELRDGWDGMLRAGSGGQDFVAQLLALEKQGCKVRSRALTTTLFARLFVGDLFIHGLGGGKYDELTDDIIRRFYGVEPPGFLVLTGTLHLPFRNMPDTDDDRRRLERLDRDLWWNPQRHVDSGPAQPLAQEKQRWIDRSSATAAERFERHETLRKLTRELRPFVQRDLEQARSALEETQRHLRINEVHGRRDFAFCLYPEVTLRPFCEQFT